MREADRRAVGEVRRDRLGEHLRLHVIRQQHEDDLRATDGLGGGRHGQPGLLGPLPRRAVGAQPDDDVDAGVAQVQRVGVPLAAEAEHGDLAGEQIDVAG